MKRFITNLAVALTSLAVATNVCAKKEDFFLDSKSQIVGIATVGNWPLGDLYEKFIVSDLDDDIDLKKWEKSSLFPPASAVTSHLNDINAGRIVIDNLLKFDGTTLDDSELRRRAMLNANRSDKERAEKDLIDMTTLLKDDIDPILMHNFIFIRITNSHFAIDENGEEKLVSEFCDYIYKVEMTSEIIDKIYNAWNDPEAYKTIHIPVRNIPTPEAKKYEDLSTLTKALEKTDNDFMLYGQLLSRSSIDLPRSIGVSNGDNVTIYRQEIDRNGKPYSKRIARGKVSGFDKNETQAHFFRVAGNAGSRKNGDVATISHSKNTNFAVMGEYSKHNWGIKAVVDYSFGFRKSGLYSHLLCDLGVGLTENPGKDFSNGLYDFDAPIFFNVGLGWGIGKTFMGLFDIMPYFMAQYDAAFMTNTESDVEPKDITGSYVRIPIGVRFNINIIYPMRLSLEAGYAVRFNVGDTDKAEFVDNACHELGVRRSGIFLGAGLYF